MNLDIANVFVTSLSYNPDWKTELGGVMRILADGESRRQSQG